MVKEIQLEIQIIIQYSHLKSKRVPTKPLQYKTHGVGRSLAKRPQNVRLGYSLSRAPDKRMVTPPPVVNIHGIVSYLV